MRSVNIYCFRAELSAEGAKRGVETPPEVFPPDDLPRPSRPKAGLGLVMMMMMMHLAVQFVGKQVADQSLAVPDRSPLALARNLPNNHHHHDSDHDDVDNGNDHGNNNEKALEPGRNLAKSSSFL